MNKLHRPAAKPVGMVRSTAWLGLYLLALVMAPILVINKFILGHSMPNWAAGVIALVGWCVVRWLQPWIVQWHRLDRAPRRAVR